MIFALPQRLLQQPESTGADTSETQIELTSPPAPRLLVRVLLAGICLALALGFRLPSLRTAPPHPDEHHWVTRAAQVLSRLETKDYLTATTHLGHPGIPAALTMAAAQSLAARWNDAKGAEPYSARYIDPLAASRVANALSASLIFPVLLLFASTLTGFLSVLLAALLLAFDCQHIAATRIAHIDGMLTLLATSCLLLAFHAERTRSVTARIGAGVLWGLSIGTKPTAAALIGIIFAYKAFRRLLVSRFESERLPLVVWSDIWAVIAGHAVLGALYTKLWDPGNTYITKHHIQPKLSFMIAHLSDALHAHPILPVLIVGTLWALSFYAFRVRPAERRRPAYHLAMLGVLFLTFLLAADLFPYVMENFVRFWYWVGGLSKRVHEAYGMVWKPPVAGYPEIWLRRMPAVALVGSALGLAFLAAELRNIRSRLSAERVALLLTLAVSPMIWSLPLSVSSKQAARYLLPVFPVVFLFASWGLVKAGERLGGLLASARALSSPSSWSLGGGVMVLLAAGTQLGIVSAWKPDYTLYFNSLAGGIPAAVKRGFVLNPTGYDKALQLIHETAVSSGAKQRVEVLGDLDLMKYAYSRMYQKELRKGVELLAYRGGTGSEWILEFTNFSERNDIVLADTYKFPPVLSYDVHGGTVYRLLRVNTPSYDIPETLEVRYGARRMGKLDERENGAKHVVVAPSFAKAGYIHFDQYARLAAGSYRLSFPLLAWADPELPTLPGSPDEEVVRLEASSQCTRVVRRSEISSTLAPVVLDCTFEEKGRVQLSVYWFGGMPLELGDITIERIEKR